MTLRELLEIGNHHAQEDPANLDCEVVLPTPTDMPGMFAFEGACAGVTGLIELGPSPNCLPDARGEDKAQPMTAFLIAPHSYHGEIDGDHDAAMQKALN